MNRLTMTVLLLSVALVPLSSAAAQSNSKSKTKPGSSTTIKDYGQQFLYGQGNQDEAKENAAQKVWQYSGKYNQKPVNPDEDSKKVRILPQGTQFIYFVRTPEEKSNEATLRLVTPVSVNGCMNMIPPTVTVRHGAGMMAFKIQDGDVALDKSVRYAHYQCHQGANVAQADIKLNRAELMENNIKSLTFQTDGGAMDRYDVEWSGERLSLIPKNAVAFKPFEGSGRFDPLSHYFYPDSTIVLYAPSASKNADLSGPISNLATSKGLVPVAAPGSNAKAAYFTDPQDILASSLAFGANAYVGTITVPEKFQGPDGVQEREKPLDVYARRPGALD